MSAKIDIRPDHLTIVQDILHKHLPQGISVYVFGSRATWNAKDYSDLDIALLKNKTEPTKIEKDVLLNLENDFEESDLPWKVDLVDLSAITPKFRAIVERDRVELPLGASVKGGGEWGIKYLTDIANISTGKLDSNKAIEHGKYPFFTCAPVPLAINNYAYDCDAILLAGNNANGVFHLNKFKGKFNAYQRTYIITNKDGSILDLKYLFYNLKTQTNMLGKYSLGTATKFLTMKIIAPLKIPLPPLPEQKAIAHVLGSLDDKIELNRKINQTLEAMMQALFKSWFVDFDPVIDNALKAGNPIPEALAKKAQQRADLLAQQKQQPRTTNPDIASHFPSKFELTKEMGWIPKGWKVSEVGSVSECFDKKRIPLSKKQREEKKPGAIPYYGATSVMEHINEYIFDNIYLLIGEDGSVVKEDGSPFIQYIWGKSWVNNHAHVLQGKGISTEHLMLFMQNQNVLAYVTGAVQLKINQKNMNRIPFLLADVVVNSKFCQNIEKFYSKIRMLHEENNSLRKLRDTLLPKLLSGELHIPDVKQFIKEQL